jgi:hypothetical protein
MFVFLHPMNMLVLHATFSLIELNAWKDEWLIIIKTIKKEKKSKKMTKKKEKGKEVI